MKFFKSNWDLDAIDIQQFSTYLRKYKEEFSRQSAAIKNSSGQINKTHIVSLPIQRIRRLFNHLEAINTRLSAGNLDKLTRHDLANLKKIIEYTLRCVPGVAWTIYNGSLDEYQNTANPYRTLSTIEIEDYRKAASSIHDLGLSYHHVARIGLNVVATLLLVAGILACFTLALGFLPAMTPAVTGILAFGSIIMLGLGGGAAVFAKQAMLFTDYEAIETDVKKTIKSPACKNTTLFNKARAEPDCTIKQAITEFVAEKVYNLVAS
ncbi:MAG: hypothetical protein WC785_05525 [Tatlockia sp.]|jgi:hypothetical protein